MRANSAMPDWLKLAARGVRAEIQAQSFPRFGKSDRARSIHPSERGQQANLSV